MDSDFGFLNQFSGSQVGLESQLQDMPSQLNSQDTYQGVGEGYQGMGGTPMGGL